MIWPFRVTPNERARSQKGDLVLLFFSRDTLAPMSIGRRKTLVGTLRARDREIEFDDPVFENISGCYR
jgi:hypothetical protein